MKKHKLMLGVDARRFVEYARQYNGQPTLTQDEARKLLALWREKFGGIVKQQEVAVDASIAFTQWRTIDEIALNAELTVREVKPILADLVARGLVEKSGEKYRYRTE